MAAAKDKVLKAYPNATGAWMGGRCIISAQIGGARTVLGEAPNRESWAWADAWRRIQRVATALRGTDRAA